MKIRENLKNKRILFTILTFVMLFSAQTIVFADSDIDGHWANEIILKWADQDLIFADAQGNYKPDEKVVRAEFIAFSNRIMRFEKYSDAVLKFKDVSPTAWYYNDVAKAVAVGYIKGTSDTTMSPEANITREQGVTLIVRLMGLDKNTPNPKLLDTIADGSSIEPWAKDAVAIALENKIITPDDLKIYPKNPLTRAETVLMIEKAHSIVYPQVQEDSYEEWLKPTFAKGDGSAQNPFHIANKAQLFYLSQKSNEKDSVYNVKNYKLTANIDLENEEWTPIARDGFAGLFDGNGFIVSNVKITKDKQAFGAGLFAKIDRGTVKNLGVRNVYIDGLGLLGGLSGSNLNGTIDSCFVDGTIKITAQGSPVGVMVGFNRSEDGKIATISNSFTLAGYDSLLAAGRKGADYSIIGGIVGINNSVVENCYSLGVAFGASYYGHIIGELEEGGVMNNCYFNLEIISNRDAIGNYNTEKVKGGDGVKRPVVTFDENGLITAKVNTKVPFKGFDTQIWRFIEGQNPMPIVFFKN